MAINYTTIRALAVKLIAANGKPLTFFKAGTTLTDAAKPWKGVTGADTQKTVIGVVIPLDQMDDHEAMRRGDAIAYVAAKEFGDTNDPIEFDRMTDPDGYTWEVHGIKLIAPGPV